MQDPGHAIGTIVVGLDGSADRHEAVHWAARLAASLGAEVVAERADQRGHSS